jgi:predicted N-acetyltransferase YhbS
VDGPRLVRREEAEELSHLLCGIFGFDHYYNKEFISDALQRPVHRRGATIIAEDGKPVSHILTTVDQVSVYSCHLKVASIGGVCTHPHYRHRGYASLILQESLRAATAAGARVLIVSGDRGLYRRNHCARVGDLLACQILPESLRPGHGKLAVRRVTADHWPLLSPLNAAELVHFVRGADFFSRCCWWWNCVSNEIWRVDSNGELVAYLSLLPPWREEHRPTRTVGEYAGCRAAILDALPIIFQQTEIAGISFLVSARDEELAYLLANRGLALKAAALPGTHRLLNLPGLMRDLRPYLAARLTSQVMRPLASDQQEEVCCFLLGQERAEMDLTQAIKLILGGPDAPRIGGELGRALTSIFPLPFPLPGFNYV